MIKTNPELQPNELTPETKASMKTRIISAIVAGVVCIPLVILGDFFFFAFPISITNKIIPIRANMSIIKDVRIVNFMQRKKKIIKRRINNPPFCSINYRITDL